MNLTNSEKLQAESVSFLARQLLILSNSARDGDMDIAEALGVDIETIQVLEKTPACELEAIAAQYFKIQETSPININALKVALKKPSDNALIDECIIHGANNDVLINNFGLSNVQIATRRKLLCVPVRKGRVAVPTEAQLSDITQMWFEMKINNKYSQIEKILYVAKTLSISVCNVNNHVEQLERINQFERQSMTTAHEMLRKFN